MPLETATFISQLNPANPAHSDQLSAADSHDRLIKSTILATFPNFTAAALNSTQAQIDAAVASVVTNKKFALLAGTAAAPSLYFDLENGTGIYQSAAGSLDVTVAGVRTLQVSSAGLDVKAGDVNVPTGKTFKINGTSIFPIATAGITDKAVTYAKIQDISATNTLLGRKTAAAGPTEEIAVGAGLAISSGALTVAAQPIAGGFRNLVIKNNATTPNTKVDLTADALTVETSTGAAFRRRSVSLTIDATTNGANGLDASGLALNSWYAVLVIYNPTTDTHAGLLVKDANFPGSITLPSGYTAWARFGWMRTGAAATFYGIKQVGRHAQYVVNLGATGAAYPLPAVGPTGTSAVGGFTAVAVSPFLPSTASEIDITVVSARNSGSLSGVMCAPSNTFDSTTGLSPPPIGNVEGGRACYRGTLVLEGPNVYFFATNGGGGMMITGWWDNL